VGKTLDLPELFGAEAAGAKSLPRSDFNEEGQLIRNQ
jgi:hypothetical protein